MNTILPMRTGRLLLVDQSPFLHTPALQKAPHFQPALEDTVNFRQVPDTPIYGIGQPGKGVFHQLVDSLAGSYQGNKLTWVCMREEPLVFVGNQTVTLNDLERPFVNLEDTGCSAAQVEQRERRLKWELGQEALANGGRLELHLEQPGKSMLPEWRPVSPENLRTFRELAEERLGQVDFRRIPVSDEKAPEIQDFEALVETLKDLPAEAPRIFSCQAGRGRTTTAMVVATLMHHLQSGTEKPAASPENGLEALSVGLPEGEQARALLDHCIDRVSQVQNVREVIFVQREAGNTTRGLCYLNRYAHLLAFSAYACEQAPGYPCSFGDWLQNHPQALPDASQSQQIWQSLSAKEGPPGRGTSTPR